MSSMLYTGSLYLTLTETFNCEIFLNKMVLANSTQKMSNRIQPYTVFKGIVNITSLHSG